jgi:hypothetical protein
MSKLSFLFSRGQSTPIIDMKFSSGFLDDDYYSSDISDFSNIVSYLFSSKKIKTGILPPGVLYFNTNTIIFEKPPTQKNISYHPYMIDDIPSSSVPKLITIPVPWQVYVVTYTQDPLTSKVYPVDVYMFFRNSQILFKDDHVYLAPLSNFYANGKLCRPFFDSFEDVDRYEDSIAGVIQAAYDWVWNSNTNVDLTATIAEYYITYQNDLNLNNRLIFDYFPETRSSVMHNVHPTNYYVNSSIANSFYKAWSKIPFNDIYKMSWSNPAYHERFSSDEEVSYEYLVNNISSDLVLDFLEENGVEFDDDENHDSVSLSHFDFSYSEVLEYFDSHPRNIKKSLQDIVQNISMDPYLSSTRSFQSDSSFIHNIFNRFS